MVAACGSAAYSVPSGANVSGPIEDNDGLVSTAPATRAVAGP